jgi:hypothetical protein
MMVNTMLAMTVVSELVIRVTAIVEMAVMIVVMMTVRTMVEMHDSGDRAADSSDDSVADE